MAVLSSLLGFGTPQQTVPAQQMLSQQLAPELAPFYKDVLGKAQALYQTKEAEGFQPYTGPTVAQFTPEQEQAFTGLTGLSGTTAPRFEEARTFTKAAAAPITTEEIEERMSPYQQAVVDIEKREAQKQFEQNVLPKIRQAQISAGAFGGTRGTLLEAQTLADQARALSDIQSRGSAAAFDQAMQALGQERARTGQAATQLGALAPSQLQTGLREIGALQTVGEQRQQQTQTALDEAYQQFLQEKQQPYQTLDRYSAILRGMPTPMVQKTPIAPSPTLGQTLLGAAGTAGSLYGAFGGFSPTGLFGMKQAEAGGGIAGLPIVYQQTGGDNQTIFGKATIVPDRPSSLSRGAVWDSRYKGFNAGDRVKVETTFDSSGNKIGEKLVLVNPQKKEMDTRIQDEANVGEWTPSTIDAADYIGKHLNVSNVPERLTGTLQDVMTATGEESIKALEPYSKDIKDIVQKYKDEPKLTRKDLESRAAKEETRGLASLKGYIGTEKEELERAQAIADAERKKYFAETGKEREEFFDEREGRLTEKEAADIEASKREQFGNLAQFFTRLGTATPRTQGASGLLDVGLRAAQETIPEAMQTQRALQERQDAATERREALALAQRGESIKETTQRREEELQQTSEGQTILQNLRGKEYTNKEQIAKNKKTSMREAAEQNIKNLKDELSIAQAAQASEGAISTIKNEIVKNKALLATADLEYREKIGTKFPLPDEVIKVVIKRLRGFEGVPSDEKTVGDVVSEVMVDIPATLRDLDEKYRLSDFSKSEFLNLFASYAFDRMTKGKYKESQIKQDDTGVETADEALDNILEDAN